MLVYDKGGFFVSHRDTEKAPGMFATLVVQLPSKHTGGQLVVKHRDVEKSFDFARNSGANPPNGCNRFPYVGIHGQQARAQVRATTHNTHSDASSIQRPRRGGSLD
jgi:hypothetical protein